MSNIVYLLTNPSMPDIVKIGFTSNLTTRMRSLYSSSVPVPFECYFACTVNDMAFVEKQLHDGFDDFRINPRREFFRIDPERVVAILKMVMIKDVTPKEDIVEDEIDQRSLDKERKIRGKFNFDMINIPVGAMLSFVKDTTITASVADNNKIKFEDEIHSLSSATLKIIHRMGYTWKQVSGPTYWIFEGETLTELRSRMEQE